MVVKQSSEEDNVSNNAYEFSGDLAGNRTQMTGLEDRIRTVHLHLWDVAEAKQYLLMFSQWAVRYRGLSWALGAKLGAYQATQISSHPLVAISGCRSCHHCTLPLFTAHSLLRPHGITISQGLRGKLTREVGLAAGVGRW